MLLKSISKNKLLSAVDSIFEKTNLYTHFRKADVTSSIRAFN